MTHDLEVELHNTKAIERNKTSYVQQMLHQEDQMNNSFIQQRERVDSYRPMHHAQAEKYVRDASATRRNNHEYIQTSIAYKM
jgi:Tfp pilus tip-associated adhesin PilY1